MRNIFIFACLFACIYATPIPVQLPAAMKVCARNSLARDECLKEAIEVFFHTFYAGIEALNIPSIDPYVTEDEHFEYNQSTIRGVLNIKQAKALGLSNTRVAAVRSRATDEKLNLEIDLLLPNLVLEGNYRGEGQVNAMQMSGKGFFNMSFTDVKATFKITGELTSLDGEDYMKIVRFNLVPEGGKMKLYASGIFPDPQINSMANDLINQNWPAMYRTVLPQTRQFWEPILVDGANKIFLAIPYHALMPKLDQDPTAVDGSAI